MRSSPKKGSNAFNREVFLTTEAQRKNREDSKLVFEIEIGIAIETLR